MIHAIIQTWIHEDQPVGSEHSGLYCFYETHLFSSINDMNDYLYTQDQRAGMIRNVAEMSEVFYPNLRKPKHD